MEIKFLPFDPNASRENLPKERKLCIVCIDKRETSTFGLPPGVAIGYLRFYSNGYNFWVIPGIEHNVVTHYADCLPDDFGEKIPVWNWPKRGQLNSRPEPLNTHGDLNKSV